MSDLEPKAKVERLEGYRYRVTFPSGAREMLMDEPSPLGKGDYVSATQALAAAIGNCMCASLQYCMERSRAEVGDISSEVAFRYDRDEKGRLRIAEISIKVAACSPEGSKLERCSALFEDFCTVTKSIEVGIPVRVEFEGQSQKGQ
jgi:uncharacterized OsmC-like protein